MSKAGWDAISMKNNKYCPVTLEPELEEEASLWTPGQRRAFASKLERWARQLRVSAFILERQSAGRQRPSLTGVSVRQQRLN